jgi:hypothetical protein
MNLLQEVTGKKAQPPHFIRGYVSMMVLVEALKRADKAPAETSTGEIGQGPPWRR